MSTAAAAESFDAKVTGVADSDTVTVLYVQGETKTPKRVRLSGIDAPEKAQPFENVARENLARLAFGQVANLDCRTTDRYGRSVCLVRVGGVDVGLRLIELGMAWHFKRYSNTQPRDEAVSYAMAETTVRAARAGLWRELGTAADPVVAPWSWRKGDGRPENQ